MMCPTHSFLQCFPSLVGQKVFERLPSMYLGCDLSLHKHCVAFIEPVQHKKAPSLFISPPDTCGHHKECFPATRKYLTPHIHVALHWQCAMSVTGKWPGSTHCSTVRNLKHCPKFLYLLKWIRSHGGRKNTWDSSKCMVVTCHCFQHTLTNINRKYVWK